MSDTGINDDNQAQQQVEVNPVSPAVATSPATATGAAVPEVENKPVTPVKRTPSKRISAVERAQRESEELVKTLGGSLDIEGGRKTRSSTRGTPSKSNVIDTPPAKKSRSTVGTPKRARGRKLETALEDTTKKTPEKVSESDTAEKEEVTDGPVADKTGEIVETKASAVEETRETPVKQDDKPEPMEVDSVNQEETNTPVTESKPEAPKAAELNQQHEDQLKESSDNGINDAEKDRSSSVSQEEVACVEQDKPATVVVENNVGGNSEEKKNSEENRNSLPEEVSLPPAVIEPADPISPAAPPATVTSTAPVVPAAGNDRKAESNDCCEPKIASPPITANNDGATPQYCN